jgi:glycosyltransferase involved in cell wall biosynthesis
MTTHRLIPSALVCVPASQRADYAKVAGIGPILTHPDSVKGLTPKLNWILDHFRDEDAVVFVDDDIASVQRCFVEKGEPATIREPEKILAIIKATHILARDTDAYYFGWEASNGAVRYYTGLKPIMLTGYINGCAMGFRRGHGLRFDERIVAKNDFDIAAQNAWRHRYCVKDGRFSFCQRETFTGRGGQSAYRTSGTERRDVELLRKKFGDIFHFGAQSMNRKRDYAGVQKITMHLPF